MTGTVHNFCKFEYIKLFTDQNKETDYGRCRKVDSHPVGSGLKLAKKASKRIDSSGL